MKFKKELKKPQEIINSSISSWYSTYGQLTVERILTRFTIRVDTSILKIALENSNSFYFQLLKIPYKNILNTIISEQAFEYQTFAQKIFVDFLLSGQNDQPQGSPGDHTRDAINNERKALLGIIDKFSHAQNSQRRLIAETQKILIQIANDFNKTVNSLLTHKLFLAEGIDADNARNIINILLACQDSNQGIAHSDINKISDLANINVTEEMTSQLISLVEPLLVFATEIQQTTKMQLEQANYLGDEFRDYRNDLYNLIIKTNEQIYNLPNYQKVKEKDTKNRESLNFDNID